MKVLISAGVAVGVLILGVLFFFMPSSSVDISNVSGDKPELIALASSAEADAETIREAFFPTYMTHVQIKELNKLFTELYKKINQSVAIREGAALATNADRFYYKNTIAEAMKFLGNDKSYENQVLLMNKKKELYRLMEEYKKKFGREYPLNYKALTFTINKKYVEDMYLNCNNLYDNFLANPNMKFPSYFKMYYNAFLNHPEDYNIINKNVDSITSNITNEMRGGK